MDLSRCNCDKAGFCPVFRRNIDEKNHRWCQTSSKDKRINYYQQNVSVLKQEKKFGIIIPNYNKIGGVETWLKTLSQNFQKKISEICTISNNNDYSIYDLNIPITNGSHHASKMCEEFDSVLIWGEQILDHLFKNGKPKNLYFIHHGDETGSWANETFDIQSKHSNKLIAVNKTVAERYNCNLIENYIDPLRCSDHYNKSGKTITWAHRLSSEKNPFTFLEIARKMPDHDFILCGKGPMKNQILDQLPKNCKYEGSPSNLKHIFEKTSVFISCADQEAFGYSVGEAILSGIPVVSYGVGISAEFADVIIKNHAPIEDWITAIKNCLGESAKHSENLQNRFSKKVFVDKWSKIINTD